MSLPESQAQLELLTIPELAALAKQSRRTLERRIAAGELEVVHLSPRAIRVPLSEARRYLGLAAEGGADRLGGTIHPFPGGRA